MSTKEVAMRAHVAKVHVFHRKSIVLAAPCGQSACFLGGFGTTGGYPWPVGPRVTSVFVHCLLGFSECKGSMRDSLELN